jgi:hypothetical protein
MAMSVLLRTPERNDLSVLDVWERLAPRRGGRVMDAAGRAEIRNKAERGFSLGGDIPALLAALEQVEAERDWALKQLVLERGLAKTMIPLDRQNLWRERLESLHLAEGSPMT